MFSINQFLSEINTGGVLKTNRYHVTFAAPKYLQDAARNGRLNNSSVNTPLDVISLRCESVQLPGMSFASIDSTSRAGYGPIETMPYNIIYDDITLAFVVDSKSDVHRFFYNWCNSIVNFHSQGQSKLKDALGPVKGMKTYEVGYKDNYVTDIEISVYNNTTTPAAPNGEKVMTAKVYRAFPKLLPSVDLSWASTDEHVKLSIPFSYTDFEVEYPKISAPQARR